MWDSLKRNYTAHVPCYGGKEMDLGRFWSFWRTMDFTRQTLFVSIVTVRYLGFPSIHPSIVKRQKQLTLALQGRSPVRDHRCSLGPLHFIASPPLCQIPSKRI